MTLDLAPANLTDRVLCHAMLAFLFLEDVSSHLP